MKQKNKHVILINFIIFMLLLLSLHIYLAMGHIVAFTTYMLYVRKLNRKNKKHPKFNIKYFRDNLKKISPAYISYLLNYKIELEKDVSAHILKLYIDKFITLKNDKFIVTKKNTDSLLESDKMLLEFVEHNFYDDTFLKKYEECVKNEMFNDGYINKAITKKDIIGIFSSFITSILTIVVISVIKTIHDFSDNKVLYAIAMVFICISLLCIIFLPAIIVAKTIAFRKHGMIKRTKKGEELLEQIYGLKNFLKDFSVINDRKFDDVYLQEHYLVYAITMEVNTKVDDEILKKIKKQIRNRY